MTQRKLLYRPLEASRTGATWEMISDRVMGGVSRGTLTEETVSDRTAMHLLGEVRLENGGGFLQMALDLAPDGAPVDCAGWDGFALTVCGNAEAYNVHLRTSSVVRPWQSYRTSFRAEPEWRELHLPWSEFTPHRISDPFDPTSLRRIGLVAIGRAFRADLAVAELALYADFEPEGPNAP